MHKIIHATTLAALAAASSLGSGPAQATADTKSMNTSTCRPLTAPDATGLVFDTRGVVNSTTENKRVICGIVKDAEGPYSPTDFAYLFNYYKAGTIDGSVSCTYYMGPVGFGTPFSTFTTSGSVTAGSWSNSDVFIDSYATWGGAGAGITAVCTLSGKMTLGFFYLYEDGSTNTP